MKMLSMNVIYILNIAEKEMIGFEYGLLFTLSSP